MTETNGFIRTAIIAEIHAERDKQDAQWGGPEHDDGHTSDEWFGFIEKQTSAYRAEASPYVAMDASARGRLVKVAALAIAAIEAIDRNRGTVVLTDAQIKVLSDDDK